MFDHSSYNKKKWAQIKSDPDLHREYTEKNNQRLRDLRKSTDPKILRRLEKRRKYAREYMAKRRKTLMYSDPEKYQKLLAYDREKAAQKRKSPAYRKIQNQWRSKKLLMDLQFKISSMLRNSLNKALRGRIKTGGALDLLGCSLEYFREHIESKWTEGMNWSNRGIGKGKWHIDHVRPCASFDLTKKNEQKSCFHFLNMVPMWGNLNVSKGSLFNGKRHKHKIT